MLDNNSTLHNAIGIKYYPNYNLFKVAYYQDRGYLKHKRDISSHLNTNVYAILAVWKSCSETLSWLWTECMLQGLFICGVSVAIIITTEVINTARVYKIDVWVQNIVWVKNSCISNVSAEN